MWYIHAYIDTHIHTYIPYTQIHTIIHNGTHPYKRDRDGNITTLHTHTDIHTQTNIFTNANTRIHMQILIQAKPHTDTQTH